MYWEYVRKMDPLGRARDADESARRKTEVIGPGYGWAEIQRATAGGVNR